MNVPRQVRRRINLLKLWILGYKAVPRSLMLHKLAYEEEDLPIPDIERHRWPFIVLYPRSWVERAKSLSSEKLYDINFMGTLYPEATFKYRKWIVDFARERFTDDSYYCITDPPDDYEPIGAFDRTLVNMNQRFVPRFQEQDSQKGYFDDAYFQVMGQSKFTLCPPGDASWSMRFYECIMCRSIPVLESRRHAGRNMLERWIGYKFYMLDDLWEYRQDWIEWNYKKFLQRQTLISGSDVRATMTAHDAP